MNNTWSTDPALSRATDRYGKDVDVVVDRPTTTVHGSQAYEVVVRYWWAGHPHTGYGIGQRRELALAQALHNLDAALDHGT